MESNQTYVERLQLVISHLHKCDSKHVCTTHVTELFRGRLVWEGDVETFQITGHPKAQRCYAWSHVAGQADDDERFVTVLEISPVDSPQNAVKVAIASEVRDAKKRVA